jgi:hypothetical protein
LTSVCATQAADGVKLLNIGRNEYIAILNACKAKKLLWRVNRGLARDFLPHEPLQFTVAPWWRLAVVSIGVLKFTACLSWCFAQAGGLSVAPWWRLAFVSPGVS